MDHLSLEAYQLEKDYFQHNIFDRKKWERICRPHWATEVGEKARHIQESESAYQRGEDYPSREVRQRYEK